MKRFIKDYFNHLQRLSDLITPIGVIITWPVALAAVLVVTVYFYNKSETAMEKPKKGMTLCKLCNMYAGRNSVCDHPKNGYCQVFKFSAEQSAIDANMHPRKENK